MKRTEAKRRGGRRLLLGFLITVLALLAAAWLFVVTRYDIHADLSLFEIDIVDATTRFIIMTRGL